MQTPALRHELKHIINQSDLFVLRSRLRAVATADPNAGPNGGYRVRSLYFDNYADAAVDEKLSGIGRREKYRLRYYGDDTSLIRLEKKSKVKRLCAKQTAPLSAATCAEVLQGHYSVLRRQGQPLADELYARIQGRQLRPKVLVDYHREAYIYPPGNVRITIDSAIRQSAHVQDFLTPHSPTVPASGLLLLEVKFDAFLPDVIRGAIQLGHRNETEFSKYVVARMA